MKLENDIGVWEPNELVYKASDLPSYSYLVIEGHAQIVSPSGLRLSSIGYNELFGEASFILGKNSVQGHFQSDPFSTSTRNLIF